MNPPLSLPLSKLTLGLQICITVALALATSAVGQFLGRQGVQWWGDPVSDGSSTTFWNDWLTIVDATSSLQMQAQLTMITVQWATEGKAELPRHRTQLPRRGISWLLALGEISDIPS